MLQNIGSSLILGVISGLVATFLTVFMRSYWVNVLIPWYEERIYKDAKIEGQWAGDVRYSEEDIATLIFNLYRKSHRVYGDMYSKKSGKTYKIEGEFRNMILTITYTANALHAVDRGSFTFLLTKNGRELDGYGAFYYSPDHRITAAPINIVRAAAT